MKTNTKLFSKWFNQEKTKRDVDNFPTQDHSTIRPSPDNSQGTSGENIKNQAAAVLRIELIILSNCVMAVCHRIHAYMSYTYTGLSPAHLDRRPLLHFSTSFFFSLVELNKLEVSWLYQLVMSLMWLLKPVYFNPDEHLYCAVQYFLYYTISQYTQIRVVHNWTAVCMCSCTQTWLLKAKTQERTASPPRLI